MGKGQEWEKVKGLWVWEGVKGGKEERGGEKGKGRTRVGGTVQGGEGKRVRVGKGQEWEKVKGLWVWEGGKGGKEGRGGEKGKGRGGENDKGRTRVGEKEERFRVGRGKE